MNAYSLSIRDALVNQVLPGLAELIDNAGLDLAQRAGGPPDPFEIEQAQQTLIHALADLLELSTHDRSEDHIWGTLRPHQLRDASYARAFFAEQLETEGQGE